MLNENQIKKYIQPLLPEPTTVCKSGKIAGKIECILFDIYGTLFVSGSGDIGLSKKQARHSKALERLLQRFHIAKSPDLILNDLHHAIEQRHAELRNDGIDYPEVKIDAIWKRILIDKDMDTVQNFAVEFELIVNPVYPMPHIKEMLAKIGSQNIKMGIISNAQFYTPYLFKWLIGSSVHKLGFDPDLTLYSYTFSHAKPSEYLFRIAAERLEKINIPAYKTLFVGNDMLNDIYPAIKTGFKTALFAGDRRSLRMRQDDPRCKHLKADIIITDLIQLLEYA